MILRICAALLLACSLVCTRALAQAPAAGSTISGRILETSAGLPVRDAQVVLQHGPTVVAKTTTSADGSFSFSGVAPGTYSIAISAGGYQPAFVPVLAVEAGQPTVELQTALVPGRTGLREIAVVSAGSHAALQTSATINSNLPPAIILDQNYSRAGDALATLPFVTASTSSSLGDDESLSLRGFDPTESATLLDGHPIGPIGAHGSAYDFQVAQFYGFSNVGVIYGSGADGLYAVPVLAGAINFETINPTAQQHFSVTQGYGDLGHAMTGVTLSDTVGHVGYAFAYGVNGTNGELTGNILQSNLLNGGQSRCPNDPSAQAYLPLINSSGGTFNGGSLPPSIAAGDQAACNYNVTGDYLQRNFVGKVVGQLGPRTTLTATVYSASIYADSTGNGDTDYEPYPVQLASANGAVSGGPVNFQLPSGATTTCTGATLAALSNATGGFSCLTPQQYAADFYGPSGGGLDRYHAAVNQDYDLRLTQGIGPGNLILDGYIDNYTFVNQKGPQDEYVQAASYLDDYLTHGGVIRYDYARGKNDLSLGFSSLHQLYQNNSGASYPITPIGTTSPTFISFGPFDQSDEITENSYFAHDTWTPNDRFSVFADLDVERSFNTATTNLDPRLSFVYRPTTSDVWRITGGRATSEPDPSLVTGGITFSPPVASNPSFNPANTCGTSGLVSLGGGSSSLVKPESGNDLEVALAHRFASQATLEIDGYDTTELNPIISGVFPLSVVPAGELPSAAYFNSYAGVLNTTCGVTTYNANSFGVSIPFNAGKAVYKGLNLQTKIPIVRGLEIDGNYAMQSAQYQDLQDGILALNGGLINGAQMYGVPVSSANAGIGYSSRFGAWTARIDEHFVSQNNGYNRPAYWYATANASKTVGPITINLGVFNLFNQNSGQFGLIGLGTQGYYNQFNAPSYANPYNNNNEEYSMPVRQIWMTTTVRI
jgi:Carboxypeptidase regulatory-like domain/TonB-dependent Receptor Plug Domain